MVEPVNRAAGDGVRARGGAALCSDDSRSLRAPHRIMRFAPDKRVRMRADDQISFQWYMDSTPLRRIRHFMAIDFRISE